MFFIFTILRRITQPCHFVCFSRFCRFILRPRMVFGVGDGEFFMFFIFYEIFLWFMIYPPQNRDQLWFGRISQANCWCYFRQPALNLGYGCAHGGIGTIRPSPCPTGCREEQFANQMKTVMANRCGRSSNESHMLWQKKWVEKFPKEKLSIEKCIWNIFESLQLDEINFIGCLETGNVKK